MKPLVGISLMPETEFLNAALPLFLNNEVEVLEWSFDTFKNEKSKPEWLNQLLKEYSDNNRLIGHGVRFSLFDAKFTNRQTQWLNQLKREVEKCKYKHITEHFGFMSSNNFHEGTPLPVPLNKNTLAVGINRLQSIQQAAGLPIGIENLAFSFSIDDVKKQGEFLDKLTKPLNGFLILDLHNIFCQANNFGSEILDIVKSYPLSKVKEIHISGGSWQKSVYTKNIKKVRRDTHDEKIPKEIFNVLPIVLNLCKNVEYIIFERLGHTLNEEKEQKQFRKDFQKIKKVVNDLSYSNNKKSFSPPKKKVLISPLTDLKLFEQQQFVLKAISSTNNPYEAINNLNTPLLKDWNTQNWNPSMIETAMELLKKWG